VYDTGVCLHSNLYGKPLKGFKDKSGPTESKCKQQSFGKAKAT